MVYKITDDCINCGVCRAECPADAVFQPGVNWRNLRDKNFLYTCSPAFRDGYYSDKYFYIAQELCSGCEGYSDEPICVLACPLGCIVADESFKSTKQTRFASSNIHESIRNSVKLIHLKYTGKEFRV